MVGIIFNGIFILGLIYLYVDVGNLAFTQVSAEALGPAGFPRLLIIVLIIGLIIVTVRDILKMIKAKNSGVTDEKKGKIAKADLKRIILFSSSLVAYVVLLPYVGFILDCLLFIFATIKIIGFKKNLWAVTATVAITLIITYIFGGLFNVALSRGLGFLGEISYYIY